MRSFLLALLMTCVLPMSQAWATMCVEQVVETLPENTIFAGIFRVVSIDNNIDHVNTDGDLPQIKPASLYHLEPVKTYFGAIAPNDVFVSNGAVDAGGDPLVVGSEYKKIILKKGADGPAVIVNTRCHKISDDLWAKLEHGLMPSGKN